MTEMNKIPAHGSNVERAQIPASCKWHVQDIYADEAAWQAACAEYKALLPKLTALKGQLTTAAKLRQLWRRIIPLTLRCWTLCCRGWTASRSLR